MDSAEFELLLEDLDRKIRKYRRVGGWREAAERRLSDVRTWLESLLARRAEAQRYRIPLDSELDRKIRALEEERRVLESLVGEGARDLALGQKVDILDLVEEIRAADLESLIPEERWHLFEVWALRWRMSLERLGEEGSRDRHVRMAYALLREAMNSHPEGRRFIRALARHCDGNWEARLADVLHRLQKLLGARKVDA